MTFLVISFLAGVLTVLAPCILPLLPIVIGRSAQGDDKYKPLIVSASLAVAIIIFTLLLKASTAFISIPPTFWSYLSGGIILLFGMFSLFPHLWETIAERFHLGQQANNLLGKSAQKKGILGDIFIGMSLGPVFSSCSPTYFLILATVLPESYGKGILYLSVYALGLSLMLLLIGYLGQKFVKRLNGFSDPKSKVKRGLGLLFILVGIFIMTGTDKKIQAAVIEGGIFDITKIEQRLLTDPMEKTMTEESARSFPQYKEITNPAGFVNSDPFTLAEHIGKKIILLDFMTYSCINCQRTYPYLNAWHKQYEDDGLMIIGIHTPEFAFEHKKENVEDAAKKFGLEFPLVLDNDYGTWKAYGNKYWPRKYLIDIHGNIVYDHIGEGAYEETETKIRELLEERNRVLDLKQGIDTSFVAPTDVEQVNRRDVQSPETYFGFLRNSQLGIATTQDGDIVEFIEPSNPTENQLYLVGTWKITGEYAEAVSEDAKIIYRYYADKVFLVMEAAQASTLSIQQNGIRIDASIAGEDVNNNGQAIIQNEQLYRLIDNVEAGAYTLQLDVAPGIKAYAFTFG